MYSVYKVIYDPTNKVVYVGMTSGDIVKRLIKHIYQAIVNEDDTKFAMTIRTLGYKNFSVHMIETGIPDLDSACSRERKYIEIYDTMRNGYNETAGGMGKFVFYPSEENEIALKYVKGNSITDLVKEYNSNRNTIIRVLNRHGFLNPTLYLPQPYYPNWRICVPPPWRIMIPTEIPWRITM